MPVKCACPAKFARSVMTPWLLGQRPQQLSHRLRLGAKGRIWADGSFFLVVSAALMLLGGPRLRVA